MNDKTNVTNVFKNWQIWVKGIQKLAVLFLQFFCKFEVSFKINFFYFNTYGFIFLEYIQISFLIKRELF